MEGMEASEQGAVRPTVPKNLGLLQLIRCKRESHWKPSLEELRKGFRGWHQRGYLPHFDAPHVTQFVTYMLVDSFPVTRWAEWEPILREADSSLKRRQLEEWLDRGHGQCWLRQKEVASLVEAVLLERDREEYHLQAWVIMPNHVHLVVDVWNVPLTQLIAGWKGKSARLANVVLQRTGPFWQEDYYDTLIRDEEHFKKAVHYTDANPAKAAMVKDPREWLWSSARRRDEYGRLPGQKERGIYAASRSESGGSAGFIRVRNLGA